MYSQSFEQRLPMSSRSPLIPVPSPLYAPFVMNDTSPNITYARGSDHRPYLLTFLIWPDLWLVACLFHPL